MKRKFKAGDIVKGAIPALPDLKGTVIKTLSRSYKRPRTLTFWEAKLTINAGCDVIVSVLCHGKAVNVPSHSKALRFAHDWKTGDRVVCSKPYTIQPMKIRGEKLTVIEVSTLRHSTLEPRTFLKCKPKKGTAIQYPEGMFTRISKLRKLASLPV